jgi:hypothetical protein
MVLRTTCILRDRYGRNVHCKVVLCQGRASQLGGVAWPYWSFRLRWACCAQRGAYWTPPTKWSFSSDRGLGWIKMAMTLRDLKVAGRTRWWMRFDPLRLVVWKICKPYFWALLRDTQEELRNAREEIKDAREEIRDAREEIKETQDKLKDAWREIKEIQKEINDAREEIKETQKEIEDAREEIKHNHLEIRALTNRISMFEGALFDDQQNQRLQSPGT